MRRPNAIHFGDNLAILRDCVADATVDLIYIDPPFNTGKRVKRVSLRTQRVGGNDDVGIGGPHGVGTGARGPGAAGDRTGFGGRRYETIRVGEKTFADLFDDYLAFLEPRLVEARRVLKDAGALYVHLDYREVHYVKVLLDAVFGRTSFVNEVIWAYDYGGRTKRRWPPKHDNILVYAKDPTRFPFHHDALDRIPYMAPGLVGPEKAARGKTPTDTWFHTIVPTNGREKTGYPAQKPLGILRRIVAASSGPGDLVLDFFAGSGTTGAACLELGRRFLLVDDNPEALEVMARRFTGVEEIEWVGFDPRSLERAAAASGEGERRPEAR